MSTAVMVLNSGQCSWHKCIFCGYGKIIGVAPTFENLKKKFDDFFERLDSRADEIKIFGSGSFLDERQIPKKARKYFIDKCKKRNIERITIESRPEFITKENLSDFCGLSLTVAIGLEIADDKILRKLKKGFSLKDFENAEKIIHSSGAKLRTYLLVNLPFVKNVEKSLRTSVEYAKKFSDSIVLINLLPHKNSELIEMWLKGEWNFLSKEEFYKITQEYTKEKNIEIDPETFHFFPRFPKELQKPLIGVSEEYLTNPFYEVWQDYLQRWYNPPKEKKILLFLPCSYKKPYSLSDTHKKISSVLKRLRNYERIHEVFISSPGVVPIEFENFYPFNAYDWDEKLEIKEIKKRYIEVTSKRIENYLRAHKNSYKKIFCFLRYDSESYKALEIACKNLKIEFQNLIKSETYEKIKNECKPLQSELALNDIYLILKDNF
ncbi:MAG: DUF5591 domain-containing protein [Candidatus Altiarchaeota archaeon]